MNRLFFFALYFLSPALLATYPLSQNTTWKYQNEKGETVTHFVQQIIHIQVEGESIPAAMLQRGPDRFSLIIQSPNQEWINCGHLDTTHTEACKNPAVFLKFPLSKGQGWESDGFEYQVIDETSVQTPFQTFPSAWKMIYGPKGLQETLGTLWFVRDVGPVKIEEEGQTLLLTSFTQGDGPLLGNVSEHFYRDLMGSKLPSITVHAYPQVPWFEKWLSELGGISGLLLILSIFFMLTLGVFIWLSRKNVPQTQSHTPFSNHFLHELQPLELYQKLKEKLKANPQFADVHFQCGVASALLGKTQEAQMHFDQALNLNPNYIDALFEQGKLCLEQKNFTKACEHLERASQLKPQYPDFQVAFAKACLHLGKMELARQALVTAIRIRPTYVEAQELLAKC